VAKAFSKLSFNTTRVLPARRLATLGPAEIVSEIARELSLSVKTISTYRSRILEKMGLRNNAELMHYAMQHQLVE